MNYRVAMAFHWPHDRFSIGWEYVSPDEDFSFSRISIFLGVITLFIDYERN
jgi:hypothetical protein